MHVEERITGTQCPAIGDFEAGAELEPLGRAMHLVAVHERNVVMKNRVGFESWCTRLQGPQPAIAVIEHRQIDRHPAARLHSVADVGGEQMFGFLPWVADYTDLGRSAAG